MKLGKAWDETSREGRCWVDMPACAAVYLIHILMRAETFNVLFLSKRLDSDIEVNGACAMHHPSRHVSFQAFPDFKNAHNYVQRGRPENQGYIQ